MSNGKVTRIIMFTAAGWAGGVAVAWTVEYGIGIKDAPDGDALIAIWAAFIWVVNAVYWFIQAQMARAKADIAGKSAESLIHIIERIIEKR